MSARQCNNTEQVRVEPRPLAVSMALPTCADEHRAAAPRSPAVRDPAVSMLLLRCFNGTDGRTPDSCIDAAVPIIIITWASHTQQTNIRCSLQSEIQHIL